MNSNTASDILRMCVIQKGAGSLTYPEGLSREDLIAISDALRKDIEAYVPIEGVPVPDLTQIPSRSE